MISQAFSLRWIKPSDLSNYKGLSKFIKDYATINKNAVDDLEYYQRYFVNLESKGAVACVVEHDGFIQGVAIMNIDWFAHTNSKICSVSELYVEREYRKKGAGIALLNEIKLTLKAKGVTDILFTATVGTRAEKLYNKIFTKALCIYRCQL